MNYKFPLIIRLAYWMREREAIRIKKVSGDRRPWTKDHILHGYRFCNVSREDDRTTKWISKYWRTPHEHDPMLWHTMMMARMLNWPPTLEHVGYPVKWNARGVKTRLREYRDEGNKVFTGAYIVSTNGLKMDKLDFVLATLTGARKLGPIITEGMCLKDAHKILTNVPAIGTFMSAQIIADLKQTPVLKSAEDWWDWAAQGPGSKRGLNRIMGLNLDTRWSQEEFCSALIILRDKLYSMPVMKNFRYVCLQDLQNCLCETDKFLRLEQGGKVRAKYQSQQNLYKI